MIIGPYINALAIISGAVIGAALGGRILWGSDNICIKENKKFGGKNLA